MRSSRSAIGDRGAAERTAIDPSAAEVRLSREGTFLLRGSSEQQASVLRHQQLAVAIRQRIESRLPGRVRNLAVRVSAELVVLEGECSTYYTKQLAQHAALGILEDEHLENELVVSVPH